MSAFEKRILDVFESPRGDIDVHGFLFDLFEEIRENKDTYYWIGIYWLEGDVLKVGPYSGPKTDHVEIPVGRGVCGSAVADKEDKIIDDVSELDNYLACNLDTKSEFVGLIYSKAQSIVGQIDVDATKLAAFDKHERLWLRTLADKIGEWLES